MQLAYNLSSIYVDLHSTSVGWEHGGNTEIKGADEEPTLWQCGGPKCSKQAKTAAYTHASQFCSSL
jgi:hypothetical protein